MEYTTVVQTMIHGRSLSIQTFHAWSKGGYHKYYPEQFCDVSTLMKMVVIYRRRNDDRVANINGYEVDNKWVLPHNHDLTARYDCHINLEWCALTRTIKLLHKYMHKGHDRKTIITEGMLVIQIADNIL